MPAPTIPVLTPDEHDLLLTGDWRTRAACRTHPDPEIWHPTGDRSDAARQRKAARLTTAPAPA
ncbi:hypothetical protein GCM10027160_23920 [Streptomyces calidiresistens]|uniref:Uncharacterized protein n=1 Tax=Streptomyces calidiresistens TaxID=1485586 RepID=A0A7W3T8V0_9ACTN|nr:hypothetical protein [Streptomyces calidiresistens]MBB0232826.1 hypothetical protein [Streptomyces calidiresistens]